MRVRRWPLWMLVCALACACGGPAEPPQQTAAAQPTAPAPEDGTAAAAEGTTTKTMRVMGGTRVGKQLDDDWLFVEDLTRRFYAGELQPLYDSFSQEMRAEWTIDRLTAFRDATLAELGEETEVVGREREEKQGYRAFYRAVRFSAHDGPVEVAWVLNGENEVAGLVITPARSGS